MRFELLLMEPGDFGGGVGVLLRDGDSLGAETSDGKGQGLMASLYEIVARWKRLDVFDARFYVWLRKYCEDIIYILRHNITLRKSQGTAVDVSKGAFAKSEIFKIEMISLGLFILS